MLITCVDWKCLKVFVKLSFYEISFSLFSVPNLILIANGLAPWKSPVGPTCEEAHPDLVSHPFLCLTALRLILCYSVGMC